MDNKRQAWECKIGSLNGVEIPDGGDFPMREAVRRAFFEVTGQQADAIFSGWGSEFNPSELAVIKNDGSWPPVATDAVDIASTALDPLIGEEIVDKAYLGVVALQLMCHQLASRSGWWLEYDAMPEQYRKYFIGTKIGLIHSEVSEMMEGNRKGRMDDHLPHRKADEVELADAVIRIFDMGGKLNMDIAGAIIEKLAYNQQRADHKLENRVKEGGKGY